MSPDVGHLFQMLADVSVFTLSEVGLVGSVPCQEFTWNSCVLGWFCSFMEGEHVVYSFSLWPQLQFLRKLLIYELVLSVSYMSKEFGKSFSFLG